MSQHDDLNRIVASLSEAALDDTRWPATSALIDDACSVKGNLLLYGRGHSHDDAQIFLSRLYYRGQRCEELEREYLDVYWQIDEAAPRIRRLPDSKLVHVRELYTTQELQTSTAYNELVPRVDSQNGLRVRLDGPYGTRIVWGVADPINGGDWSLAQIESIEYILPHLRQYVSFRQALVDAEALGTSLAGLLDNGRSCVVQLDWRGQIVAANDAAQDLLRRSDGLSDQGGSLRAWSPSDDGDLQELLGRALPRFGGQGASGSMTVRRPSVLPRLALYISPVGGQSTGLWPAACRRARAGRRPGEPGTDRSGVGVAVAWPHAGGGPGGGDVGRRQDGPRNCRGNGPQRKHHPLALASHLQQAWDIQAGGVGAVGFAARRHSPVPAVNPSTVVEFRKRLLFGRAS